MGGRINIRVILFRVIGGRVLGEFWGNWEEKAFKRHSDIYIYREREREGEYVGE